MPSFENEEIARRIVNCKAPTGETGVLVIAICKPTNDSMSGDWACVFSINGCGLTESRPVFGVDSMQALSLAGKMLRAKLEYYRRLGFAFEWEGGDESLEPFFGIG